MIQFRGFVSDMCAKNFTAVVSKVSFSFSDGLTLGFTNVHRYTNEVMIGNNAWEYITVAYNIGMLVITTSRRVAEAGVN